MLLTCLFLFLSAFFAIVLVLYSPLIKSGGNRTWCEIFSVIGGLAFGCFGMYGLLVAYAQSNPDNPFVKPTWSGYRGIEPLTALLGIAFPIFVSLSAAILKRMVKAAIRPAPAVAQPPTAQPPPTINIIANAHPREGDGDRVVELPSLPPGGGQNQLPS